MRRVPILFFILCLIFVGGCSFFRASAKNDPKVIPLKYSGKILEPEKLARGGKIVVLSFQAGEDVESTPELENLVLVIIKSVSDSLNDGTSRFEIIPGSDAQTADFTMQGHILKFKKSGVFNKVVLRNKEISLAVKVKILDASSQKTVLIFEDDERSMQKNETEKDLAVRIGQDLAKFILSSVK